MNGRAICTQHFTSQSTTAKNENIRYFNVAGCRHRRHYRFIVAPTLRTALICI